MPQYLIAVFNNPETRNRPAEQMAEIIAAVDVVNQKAVDDGIFVFAGGLHDQSATTTVNPHSGTPVLSDGPYVETKEYIGGFWIIEVPDLDAALEWAKVASLACQEVLEVRPFMDAPPEGASAEAVAEWRSA
jgi:hypothetical protein